MSFPFGLRVRFAGFGPWCGLAHGLQLGVGPRELRLFAAASFLQPRCVLDLLIGSR